MTRVDVLDAATQQVLATQTVQAYRAGVYLVWNVQGHVVFRFTNVGRAERGAERDLLRSAGGGEHVDGAAPCTLGGAVQAG